ncbi:hypothetical protein [Pedosphaera parvula]|uniref:Uncharacterized protein n=1 Tax=Pedosphaera parvula (strain Ellin514) TaxID=320771 RepID=B9XBR5_PEDPL|nr:hypothetical protein [Pedosphaera parvula]EEF62950.1 hypothetical protein Cflav_PD5585 [Pedosphaera parvula Ellin514]
MKKIALSKLFVALLGIVALGALAFNILAYCQVRQEITTVERDEQVVSKMFEVTKLIILKQQLGDTNATKQLLSSSINADLARLKILRGEVSPTVDESINVLLKVASKNQNEQTVYKLSMAQPVAR